MADNTNRGWHGDSEGHREVAKERTKTKTNWWPLLFIPVAFVLGWGASDASDNADDQAYNSQAERGVGGGPDSPSISPEMESAR